MMSHKGACAQQPHAGPSQPAHGFACARPPRPADVVKEIAASLRTRVRIELRTPPNERDPKFAARYEAIAAMIAAGATDEQIVTYDDATMVSQEWLLLLRDIHAADIAAQRSHAVEWDASEARLRMLARRAVDRRARAARARLAPLPRRGAERRARGPQHARTPRRARAATLATAGPGEPAPSEPDSTLAPSPCALRREAAR